MLHEVEVLEVDVEDGKVVGDVLAGVVLGMGG